MRKNDKVQITDKKIEQLNKALIIETSVIERKGWIIHTPKIVDLKPKKYYEAVLKNGEKKE